MEQIDIQEFVSPMHIGGSDWRDRTEFDVMVEPEGQMNKCYFVWQACARLAENELEWLKRAEPPNHHFLVACFTIPRANSDDEEEFKLLLSAVDFETIYKQTNLTKYIGFTDYEDENLDQYNIRY